MSPFPRTTILIGEASHGTHEFYRERAQITKSLITEKGLQQVAVQADWPAFGQSQFHSSLRGIAPY
jgi:erythromycin esterase-like protein